MKHLSDIKIGDILWVIDDSLHPRLIALPIIEIDIKKYPWTSYHNLLLKFPDGSEKWISLFNNGYKRDYDLPFLSSILENLNDYEHDNTYLVCFDKINLYNKYISGLQLSIKSVEEVLDNGKKNLIDLNSKLNYIQSQIKLIEENE